MAGAYANFPRRWRTIWLAGALAVSGCAAAPEIPYERAEAQVKTIGIVTPYVSGPYIHIAAPIGVNFGLIGGLIEAGMQAHRDSKFTEIMQAQNFAADAYFLASLSEQLRAEGYEVVMIPVPRPDDNFLDTYPGSDPKADAYLDLRVYYGYLAAGSMSAYRPFFAAHALLMRAPDSSVLMQDAVMYNPIGAPKNMVAIPPDPARQYADFDTLAADPAGSIDGLKDAELKSAQALAALLK